MATKTLKEKVSYKHKPKKILNVHDLIKFVKGIPARFWCVDIRNDGRGHHCVLGHLDNAYGNAEENTDGFTKFELAGANNGGIGGQYFADREPGAKTDGRSIKNRVLRLLESRAQREPGSGAKV